MEDRRLTTLSIPRNFFFFVVVSEFQLNDAVLNFLLFPSDIDPLKKNVKLFQSNPKDLSATYLSGEVG